MKKLKAAIYVFINSLTSPKYYQHIVETRFSFSLKYFAVLALIASLVTFSSTVKPITSDLKEAIGALETTALSAYPEDLVVTLKSGEISINQPEPYIFVMPKDLAVEPESAEPADTTTENPSNFLVFDSAGTLNDLERYDTLILVNKTNILVQGNNKVEVYPLKDYPDGELTAETLRSLATKVRPFLNAIPYIVLGFALLGTVLYYFGFRLAYLVIVSLVLMAVGSLRGLKLSFSKYYQVGLHAITLPLIVEVLSDAFQYPINYPYWFLVLNVLIGIIGIAYIKNGATKSNVDANTKP